MERGRKKMTRQEGRTVVVDVYLTRGIVTLLVLGLAAACLAVYLVWGQKPASAAAPLLAASTSSRQFYVTRDAVFTGAQALGACDPGYHMASLWEILDPSNLTYNSDKGFVAGDTGLGPAAGPAGWIRTGGSILTSTSPGYASCHAWTRGDSGDYGSTVWLGGIWNGTVKAIGTWDAGIAPCSTTQRVWCVQDNVGSSIYLPLQLSSY
jgi:hypothetical protein